MQPMYICWIGNAAAGLTPSEREPTAAAAASPMTNPALVFLMAHLVVYCWPSGIGVATTQPGQPAAPTSAERREGNHKEGATFEVAARYPSNLSVAAAQLSNWSLS